VTEHGKKAAFTFPSSRLPSEAKNSFCGAFSRSPAASEMDKAIASPKQNST
jgi:hypothetical protein